MIKRWENAFGIDLGTSSTIIYQKGKGIVLHEPTVVAIDEENGSVRAIGTEAQAMIGRTPGRLSIVYPLKDGVIANYDSTTLMLQHFFRKIQGRTPWFRGARAVEETVIHKGARKAVAIEEPLAAALGAGLPVEEPIGSMVVDIGGGTTQVAIISLGGVVVSRSTRRAGMSIDRDIIDYVKRRYNLAIGERTAEELKKAIGTAVKPEENSQMTIRGRDQVSGLPKTIAVSDAEIYELLDEFLQSVTESIRLTLEQCPPELAGDVMERGILLCGGGALLRGLDKRLQDETGVPVIVADQPQECTALGAGKMLEFKELRA